MYSGVWGAFVVVLRRDAMRGHEIGCEKGHLHVRR
jgi:hypothetical protein